MNTAGNHSRIEIDELFREIFPNSLDGILVSRPDLRILARHFSTLRKSMVMG
ncbi:hypothetical protein [Desulfuribacillus stibiiarsenatis]|uniref:hypothetical protein n=1 Tax=Desulfuribacillus stibiiarsenatis TaxID=1390249 RepID=UPI001C40896D|nr:hypothetical protein [Desulfuribacillus stibiiarsenatis]